MAKIRQPDIPEHPTPSCNLVDFIDIQAVLDKLERQRRTQPWRADAGQDLSATRILEISMKTMLLILILIVSAGCVGLSSMPMQTYNAPSTYETSRSTMQKDGLPGAMEDSCLVEGGE